LWVSGALFAAAFVILAPLAIWIYMLVFAFSSLWFAHYCLAALQILRTQKDLAAKSVAAVELPSSQALALTLTHDPSFDPKPCP
jgi:hypothetical protein